MLARGGLHVFPQIVRADVCRADELFYLEFFRGLGVDLALNPHGLRLQIRRAIWIGTDHREILQVLQMTAHLGVHACTIGVPLLLEAIGEKQGDGGEGKAP